MQGDKMRVAVMGMGRLGRSLVQMLSPHPDFEVVGWRRKEPIPTDIDVYWICVSDQSIARVAGQIPSGSIVLHASGALDVSVLRPHRPAGSLHPLQSFPGPEIAIPAPGDTPAAASGDPEAVEAAQRISSALGFRAFEMTGDRRAYHAAAVIAGNFATLLLDQASELLVDAGVDLSNAPKVLAPLAIASIQQATTSRPLEALTGPVARRDTQTIGTHLDYLREKQPEIFEMYRLLTRILAERLRKENRLETEDLDELIRLLG